MPSHTHPLKIPDNDDRNFSNSFGQHPVGDYIDTEPSGNGQPHNNMMPYIVLNYIIKY